MPTADFSAGSAASRHSMPVRAHRIHSRARFALLGRAIPFLVAALACAGQTAEPVRRAAADPPGSVLTAEDVARLRGVEAAAISPDGRHAAYVLSVPRIPGKGEDGPNWSELHVIDLDPAARAGNRGAELPRSRPFVTGKVNVGNVQWKPDGTGISFTAKLGDDKHKSLYVIPVDGGQAVRVADYAEDIGRYDWSPDGRRVAFLATEKPEKRRKELKDKGFKQEIYEEDWRPTRVFVVEAEADKAAIAPPRENPETAQDESRKSHERRPGGETAENSTPPKNGDSNKDEEDDTPGPLDLPGSASNVKWSPDGKRLAVALSRTPLIDDVMMFCKVHLVDIESGKDVGKVELEGKLANFEFSPDGTRLALIAGADIHDPAEGRLWVVSAEGGKPRNVLPDLQAHVRSIAWQNPQFIMYVAHQGVGAVLGKVRSDGTEQKVIFRSGAEGAQDARPAEHATAGGAHPPILNSVSLTQDGQSGVFTADSARHPAEVFLMSHGDAEPRRATDSNPWLAGARLAQQRAITYRARDGLELQGILVYPLEDERSGTNGARDTGTPAKPLTLKPDRGEKLRRDDTGRHPLVLVVHGGPEAHYTDGWLTRYSNPAQVLAARGFAVFFPNYRGSTGRGVEFSKLGQADYAGKEFDDLVDGVNHLVESGLVDKGRVGVTGGSYGGYATAWCATKFTEHFAAGVMFVGISDAISKFGTTDIPQEWNLVHSRMWPWENWDFFRERSPITWAGQCRTPLLICHGKDDPRVHPSQSLELYRFLKTHGKVPVRLVWYPGEPHGNQKAAAKYDYCLRLMQWMEHYLVSPGGDPPPFDIDYDLASP